MQAIFRQRFCFALALLMCLNLVVAWQPFENLLPKASAATTATKTLTFARNSSTLTGSAKLTLVNWQRSLISAKSITVTGYAPNIGNLAKQKQLAMNRAIVVRAKIRSAGATATITVKTALLRISASNTQAADKAVIAITKLKINPTTSPSVSPTASSSPSASSTPTPTALLSGGKFIMNFVDCNAAHKQVIGTTIFYRPAIAPQVNQSSVNLPESATSNEPNNLMNCAITWQDVKVSPGEYRVAIEARCVDILDSEVSGSAACTPAKYSYFDQVTKTRVTLTGSGPEAIESGYRMVIELPATFTESSSLVIETDFE
ncbi:MAG: OmpA family protein [Actinomycetales bacterium]|nr:OmpA family protein [Actinomycetales bacterium]